jgi:hypothetical protein
MSLLDRLLSKGREELPESIGKAYDKTLKVGSYVESGIEAYKSITAEIDAAKRFLKRFDNKDPQAVLYTLNTILGDNPIKIPEYMSKEDIKLVRSFFLRTGILNPDNIDAQGEERHEQLRSIVFDNPNSYGNEKELPKFSRRENPKEGSMLRYDKSGKLINEVLPQKSLKDRPPYVNLYGDIVDIKRMMEGKQPFKNGELTKKYKSISTPYNPVKSVNSPEEAIKYVTGTLHATVGYKEYNDKLSGFEPGTDNQWDIQLKPYIPDSGITFTPELPSYRVPKITADGNISSTQFSFGANCPCLEYNLQFGNLSQRDIKLFNGSQFQFTAGFSYDMVLSLEILDDVYKSFHKYMNKYINSTYNLATNEVAPYNQSAFEITLILFRSGYQVNYMMKLIGIPINYTPILSGQSEPNTNQVHLDFSIIGLAGDIQDNSVSDGSSSWERSTRWTDVILNPGGTK